MIARRRVVVLVAAVVSASCTTHDHPCHGDAGPRRGGVDRTAVPDFGLIDRLDPTGGSSSVGWEDVDGHLTEDVVPWIP
jgi:hypothetical protein